MPVSPIYIDCSQESCFSFPEFPSIELPSSETIQKVALGALAFLIEFPLSIMLGNAVVSYMGELGFTQMGISQDQDIVALWKYLGSISVPFVGVALKTALLSYIVFIGPILEEIMFREELHAVLHQIIGDPDSVVGTTLRVVGNGFLFGCAHLSPFQGWTNVPVFVVTFAMGCVFAALREGTGDIVASSTTHILHNGTVMAIMLLV